MTDLPIIRKPDALRQTLDFWRAEGWRIGFVPTMGALHEGHLSLIDRAREHADKVVASIFVNPTQFGPSEDFEAYPRDERRDAALLAEAGCDLLYAPGVESMYPDGFATTVNVTGVSEGLCGGDRPGHFAGVATVVTKLLNQVRPDAAVFGEKDYQQLQVIRRVNRDLDIGVKIIGAATLREADGLAMSSRNRYLTATERRIAPALHQALTRAAKELAGGGRVDEALAAAREAVLKAGFGDIDYIEARHAETLSVLDEGPLRSPARVFGAAWLGKARLIDNVAV